MGALDGGLTHSYFSDAPSMSTNVANIGTNNSLVSLNPDGTMSDTGMAALGLKGFSNITPKQYDVLHKNGFNSRPSAGLWGKDGFGLNKGTLGTLGTMGQLGSGLAGIYLGFKQLGLQKDAFNFNKMDSNRKYAMAKDAYDKNVKRADTLSNELNAGRAHYPTAGA